jgi:hypothetical protein
MCPLGLNLILALGLVLGGCTRRAEHVEAAAAEPELAIGELAGDWSR